MELHDIVLYADDATTISFQGKVASFEIIEHMIRKLHETGDGIYGVDALTATGNRVTWRHDANFVDYLEINWRNAPAPEISEDDAKTRSLVTGRRVLSQDRFFGYGVIDDYLPASSPEEKDRFSVSYVTGSGALVSCETPIESVEILPDTMEITVLSPDPEVSNMTIDISTQILALTDAQIRDCIIDVDIPYSAEYPHPAHAQLRELFGAEFMDQFDGSKIKMVESVSEFFGGVPVKDNDEELLRVPDSIFSRNLENTAQCRNLEGLTLDPTYSL